MPGARFFPGARLNFAQNLLRYRDDQPALIFRNERGQRRAALVPASSTMRWPGSPRWLEEAAWVPAIGSPPSCRTFPSLHRHAGHGGAGRDLVVLLARFRPGALLERFGQIAPKVLFCSRRLHLCRQDIR